MLSFITAYRLYIYNILESPIYSSCSKITLKDSINASLTRDSCTPLAITNNFCDYQDVIRFI